MTTTPIPIEQFIQRLEELERTMTRGPWVSDGLKVENAHHDIAMCDPTPPHLRAGEDARYNASGIAHLKNANPTAIAMFKAAIEGLKRVVNGDHSGTRSRESHHAVQTLAHLNTLAASALGTNGDEHDT